MLFMHGIVPSGPLQHHRFSGFRWIRNLKRPKSHTFSFLSSTDRMDAGTAFGLPFMSDHVWASCLMFKMFRTCRNIILSLWLLVYFVLLRLQVLLRNCCTCFSQCTNSGPLSWEFQDVCHSSTMASHLAGIFPPCILQRCSHDSACGTLSRSMTPTRPSSGSSRTSKWCAACHTESVWFQRFLGYLVVRSEQEAWFLFFAGVDFFVWNRGTSPWFSRVFSHWHLHNYAMTSIPACSN